MMYLYFLQHHIYLITKYVCTYVPIYWLCTTPYIPTYLIIRYLPTYLAIY